jgi:hypothetical protein
VLPNRQRHGVASMLHDHLEGEIHGVDRRRRAPPSSRPQRAVGETQPGWARLPCWS